MAHQTEMQKTIVEGVMHDFKEGRLEQRNGEPVTNPQQAIAIALHEAGASNEATPASNRAALTRTRRRAKAVRARKAP